MGTAQHSSTPHRTAQSRRAAGHNLRRGYRCTANLRKRPASLLWAQVPVICGTECRTQENRVFWYMFWRESALRESYLMSSGCVMWTWDVYVSTKRQWEVGSGISFLLRLLLLICKYGRGCSRSELEQLGFIGGSKNLSVRSCAIIRRQCSEETQKNKDLGWSKLVGLSVVFLSLSLILTTPRNDP